ncbi:hypothetical protein QQZ08_006815 [Neonectria magnoliae]|uniref:Uncharacterized protein n=1 Tax=Neonectria magnoliae TaxID=2732573 RepID=A0ABR1I0Z2_9HYPO
MKAAFRGGCITARSLRGVEASFTISMDDAYDYNILGDDIDPDDLYHELKSYFKTASELVQNSSVDTDALENHLSDTLARMVFASNIIENAGGGLDITLKLCRTIFQGNEIGEIHEQDAEYEALKRDLVRKDLSHGIQAVLRSRREIVQHAEATSYIFERVYVNNDDISEEIIL